MPARIRTVLALTLFAATAVARAQTPAPDSPPQTHYVPSPAFDLSSINTGADPCNDFYKFACGNFATNHPIPADQSHVDQFYVLSNVNTQELSGILQKFAVPSPDRTPNEQKIGDFYAACMNTPLIEKQDLAPIPVSYTHLCSF